MKYLSIVVVFLFFTHQSFSQKEKVLYPMNWVGINLSKTLGVNNQIIDFELRRKIYKKNKIEVGVSANLEFPFDIRRKRFEISDGHNNKYGITPEFNYVLSENFYLGLGTQFEKYTDFDKFHISPKLVSGFVIHKKYHLVIEAFVEYNKVSQPKDAGPIITTEQLYEKMSYKTTIGIGIKKSIFHPKAKWRTHKRRKGVIRTL